MVAGHSHRPTLKQQNKPFKSRHSTKSAIKDLAKGRAPRASAKALPTSNAAQTRANRRNAAKQAQQAKRQALIAATRIFSGSDGAPRIVAVIPLCADVSAKDVVLTLVESIEDGSADTSSDCPDTGVWKFRADRFKATLQFIILPCHRLFEALDAAKVADYVIFALSPDTEVEPWGDLLLRCLQAQGLPEVVTVVHSTTIPDPKTRPGINKSLLSFIRYFVPAHPRLFDLSTNSDSLNAVRALCDGKPSDPRWRDRRVRLLAESLDWEGTDELGTLKITGVIRGSTLSADRLIHIPNFGDYQISAIYSAPLKRGTTTMDLEPTLLFEQNSSSADSLISTNETDEMANEQTWPTEEEMKGLGDTASVSTGTPTKSKAVRRVPKGTSSYQAAWIVDESDDEEGDDEDEDEDEDEDGMHDDDDVKENDAMSEREKEEETEILVESDEETHKSVAFNDLDMEEESKELANWRAREREFETDNAFPDEVDTPKETPARIRFQRYRGLRSFRTSPWDPFENLPKDYARIFQLEDWERTGRKVANEIVGVPAGQRVTIYLKDVPRQAAHNPVIPFVLFGLHRHEHKMTVLNFTIQRNTEYKEPVRSKDSFILCVGPRRLLANPIFSQHTRGGGKGSNNVHKFERFLKPSVTSVATIYGPIIFGKQPCLVLKQTSDNQAPELVATGTFLNPSSQRIIAKRIILTGHPFKVHKKTATVRYMFFTPDDIKYYSPIQLHTKYGRTGHIRESLGTHGYFKAHFDAPINQMDTVCMNLYKRVYPKWSNIWKGEVVTPNDRQVDPMEE